MATCKNCNETDLIWRKSVKGNWYLSSPESVSTLTHGQTISIPFAHHCIEETPVAPKSIDRLIADRDNLIAIKNQFPDSWTQFDELELQVITAKLEA